MKKKESKLPAPKRLRLGDYDVLQTLGTGSFGRVRLSKESRTKKFVAIKILKKAEIIRLKQVDHIMSECCILGSINHPFIVRFLPLIYAMPLIGEPGWSSPRRQVPVYGTGVCSWRRTIHLFTFG